MNAGQTQINGLPPEILGHISSYLDDGALLNWSSAARCFRWLFYDRVKGRSEALLAIKKEKWKRRVTYLPEKMVTLLGRASPWLMVLLFFATLIAVDQPSFDEKGCADAQKKYYVISCFAGFSISLLIMIKWALWNDEYMTEDVPPFGHSIRQITLPGRPLDRLAAAIARRQINHIIFKETKKL